MAGKKQDCKLHCCAVKPDRGVEIKQDADRSEPGMWANEVNYGPAWPLRTRGHHRVVREAQVTIRSGTATLATCPRCEGYVMVAKANGLVVAVDPTPLPDKNARTQCLLQNRALYVLKDRRLYPVTLHTMTLGSIDEKAVVAAHGCPTPPRDMKPVEVAAEDPRSAPATRGTNPGGRIPDALGVRGPMSSVAGSASHRLSDTNCNKCGGTIGDERYSACEWRHETMWIFHERCL